MNIKKKFEAAKSKIKEHAPEIIFFGTALAGIAYCVYSVGKTIQEGGQEVLLISSSESEDEDDRIVILATTEAQEMINGNDSFNLRHIVQDLYALSVNPED